MKTKSEGGIVSENYRGWQKDYTWSNSLQDWVYSSTASWDSTIQNGSIRTITYDNSRRQGKLKRTRKCVHTTVHTSSVKEQHSYYLDAAHTKKRTYQAGGPFVASPSPLALPDLSSIHMEALDFFKSGCVEKHFDLAVDLFEWKQVTTLLPSLSSTIKSLKKNLLKYSFDFRRDSKRALKDLSDLHLAYSFGIRPLVSDIVDMIKSLRDLESKIAWLRKNQGRPVKVSFSKDLSTVYQPSTSTNTCAYREEVLRVLDYKCFYRAYALLVYNVEGLSDLELKLRVLTRNFGLDKPAVWVWEMVPFSFVLDWVLKVGDLIENSSPSVSLPYTFLDVGYTVKISETRSREWYFVWPYKGDSCHLHRPQTRTLFYREPGLPTSFSVATGDPGANQLALAISLAIQRWK